MEMACTAVFRKVPEGYIALVEEFAGAKAWAHATLPRFTSAQRQHVRCEGMLDGSSAAPRYLAFIAS